jgi:hypothetical protein
VDGNKRTGLAERPRPPEGADLRIAH